MAQKNLLKSVPTCPEKKWWLKCGLKRFELVIDEFSEITNICRDVVQMGPRIEAFKHRP